MNDPINDVSDCGNSLYCYEAEDLLSHAYDAKALELADCYYYENEKDKAKDLYEKIFRNGFDLNSYGYSESLSKYLEVYDNDPCDFLKELIAASPKSAKYEIDLSNTYLLLIIGLKSREREYIDYLNTAIDITLPLVKEYREGVGTEVFFSDSDIERNLCELLTLKLDYCVENKDKEKAAEVYNELTEEIQKSDCVRYYHARDRIYNKMNDTQNEGSL